MSPRPLLAFVAFVAAVAAANLATQELGLLPLWPGSPWTVTAGTFLAGLALGLRDLVQRWAGPTVAVAALLLAVGVTALTSSPALAVASGAAFLASGLVDTAVFSRLADRSFPVRWLVSNTVAFPVDTVLFLVLAGFPVTVPAVLGQQLGKLLHATLVPLLLVQGVSRVRVAVAA